MTDALSRRLFLGGLGGMLGGAALAGAPAVSLRPVPRPAGIGKSGAPGAEALIAKARLEGDVGFAVIDLRRGTLLEAHEGATALPPASITKSITALYALAYLGAGYRYTTRLLAEGGVSDGVVQGDLILAGSGDPTLDTEALAGLAARLKARGIREVRGRLRVHAGILPFVRAVDPDQPEHVAYNPAISGLNLNFNRVHFEWKRNGSGYDVTMDARAGRYRPAVQVARMAISDRAAPVYTYEDAGSHDAWTVARGQLGNGGARWLPVRRPEDYAAEVFATLARAHGIVLRQGAPLQWMPRGAELASHPSAPLRDILRDMLKYSNNMTAEAVGLTATVRRAGTARSLAASAREMGAWAARDLDMEGARFVDHSGLGDSARVTPLAMARAMSAAHGEGVLAGILGPFRLRDVDGRVQATHPISVSAKTGTLYFVSTLAGYMRTPDGRDLAFAIQAADTAQRARIDSKSGMRPAGARAWNGRAKRLQQGLIERWGQVYGG